MNSEEKISTTSYRSKLMSNVKQSGTKPEMIVRSLLHEYGIRFRIQGKDLPGKPDIVNRNQKWIIFVHGCFWHSHNHCRKATIPKRNREFWINKFETNRNRDEKNIILLGRMGYSILTLWQCEIDKPELLNSLVKNFLLGLQYYRQKFQ